MPAATRTARKYDPAEWPWSPCYHGHHDAVVVSLGVPYEQIGDLSELA